MRALARLVVLLSIVATGAGCQFVPAPQPALTCVDVPVDECERQAAGIIQTARQDTPDKRIVSISISRHDGVSVMFADGTGWSMIP